MHAGILGGTNFDRTPSAVNWADITVVGGASGDNANQTISGITTPISIKAAASILTGALDQLLADVNGAGFVTDATVAFQVLAGQTVRFRAVASTGVEATVTVTNESAVGATLDTFAVGIVP
jgi:hypothetical protein